MSDMNKLPEALKFAQSLQLFNAIPTSRLQEEIGRRDRQPIRERLSFTDEYGAQMVFVKCPSCGGNGMNFCTLEAFHLIEEGFKREANLCEACGGTGGGKTPEGNRICVRSKGQRFCRNEKATPNTEFGEPPFEVFTLDSNGYKVSTLKTDITDFNEALRFALAVDDACKEGNKRKEKAKKVIPL